MGPVFGANVLRKQPVVFPERHREVLVKNRIGNAKGRATFPQAISGFLQKLRIIPKNYRPNFPGRRRFPHQAGAADISGVRGGVWWGYFRISMRGEIGTGRIDCESKITRA